MKDDFDLKNLVSNKKKRKNSRTKGNAFERKICKLLNEFFNTTEFMRSPGSGAFSTTHNLPDHLKFSGDLITPKTFKYTFELKHGYNKESLDSLFNKNSNIWKFIAQAEKDSKLVGKPYLILFKQNNRKILCICEKNETLLKLDCIVYKSLVIVELENLLTLPLSYFFNT